VDEDGREIPGGGTGYRYFGRAKDLPGVKELFEQAKRKATGKMQDVEGGGPTRGELMARGLDAGYYGYNLDEEDGTLLAYEAKREREAFDNMLKRDDADGQDEDSDWESIPGDTGDGVGWALPTPEQVQEELVERRRRRLLDKLG
jgi:hypothetical protein